MGTQMKRQNFNNGLAVEESGLHLATEETKQTLSADNGCKRRRKSGQNNNDSDLVPPDIDCDTATGADRADALNTMNENRTSASQLTEAVVSIEGESEVTSDYTNKMDEVASSSVANLNTSESSNNPENGAETLPVMEPEPTTDTNGSANTSDNMVIADSNTVDSTLNAGSASNQRQHRVRQRSYRRSIPEMSSASASPTQGEANNDSNHVPDSLAQQSDDSDAPLIFQYDTHSSDSNDDFSSLGSEELFIQSSEDDTNLEEDLGMLEDADENNGEGERECNTNGISHSRYVFGLVDNVLNKTISTCKFNTTMEVIWREYGISSRYGRNPLSKNEFNTRFYASQFVVERMKLSHCLRRHNGCVNSLNFNRSGDLLCSGSDDKRIVVWDWARNKFKHVFKSGHRENIFQAKFITSGTALDIVSAGRDGQVRRAIIPSSGKTITTCLYKHRNAVHKLVVCPNSPLEILSVGEDGHIRHSDLRSYANSMSLLKVTNHITARNHVRLFSIAHHPYLPEVCVCGSDQYVRVYDKRKFNQAVHEMCPLHLANMSASQVTCCTYNHNGTEILATYSDEQIYLFDNTKYTPGSFLHDYRGHYNHRTIKGVNFFGPNSEYVISGSDCGNLFFWDKNTEAIVNFMSADALGVVNCLEPHPSIPVLATSGLDYSVKVWTPGSERTTPEKGKIKACITRNIWRSGMDGLLDSTLNDIILEAFHPDVVDSDASSSSIQFAPDVDNTSSSSSSCSDSSNGTASIENNDHQYYAHDSDQSSDNDNVDPLNDLSCRTQ